MLDLVDEFRALLEGLERGSVDYAVCGGLAFAIHARPRRKMTRTDMSPRAVTVRLLRTAQLRRLCLELRRGGGSARPAPERPREFGVATKASFKSREK